MIFLRETLEEKVRQETGYQAARKRQIALMKRGFHLGTRGKISISREELHERRKVFIDTNVFVFAYDASAEEKHKMALDNFV